MINKHLWVRKTSVFDLPADLGVTNEKAKTDKYEKRHSLGRLRWTNKEESRKGIDSSKGQYKLPCLDFDKYSVAQRRLQ